MRFTGEVQVIPIGAGVSVREQVRRAHGLLASSPLDVEIHGQGTNVEGELDNLLDAIRTIHQTLHDEGTVRLATFVKIGTRTDKAPSLAAKIEGL